MLEVTIGRANSELWQIRSNRLFERSYIDQRRPMLYSNALTAHSA